MKTVSSIVTAALVLFFATPLMPQSAAPANPAPAPAPATRAASRPNWPPAGAAPRTADGKPDLSGNWEPNAIRMNVDMVRAGVDVPFQPWAEKLYDERKANISRDDPEARCLPPGVPRMSTTPYPFRIVQTPALTVIVYEGGAHVWRQIFTDGRPHSQDPNPSWLGESIGH